MKAFAYRRAGTFAEGAAAAQAGARPLAGGTDLVPLLRRRLLSPVAVVDLCRLGPDAGAVVPMPDGGLRIGALCTLASLAADPRVRRDHAALAEAASTSATPQIRNRATLGGNLCQYNRCWYFRGGIPCHLTGGHDCPAADGDNRYHALFADGPCVAVHPSDPAVALAALGATVEITGPEGDRQVGLQGLLRPPAPGTPDQADLRPGELVAAVRLQSPNGRRSAYEKGMDRAAWAFALVSAAVACTVRGGVVTAADVVLGGVAGVPHRATESEARLLGRRLDAETIAAASAAAAAGARPLRHNGYKVELAQALVRAALTRVADGEPASAGS